MLTHKEKVNKLGSELLENEVIFKNDLSKIFGERQWKSYEEEQLLKLDEEKKASKKKTKVAVKKTTAKKANGKKLD